MNMTAILLFVCCLQVSATGLSQTITYSGKDVNISEIFTAIKKQTGYLVIANKKQVDKMGKVSVDAKNVSLPDFMNMILEGKDFDFFIEGNNISVKEKKVEVIKLLDDVNAPPVSGVIKDAEGNPLGGINIVIKGTKRGVVTDAYGNFKIDAKEGEVLVISSINYVTKEIKIGSLSTSLIVALEKSVSKLDEVEYIAYGTSSKRFNTAVTSTVTAKEIENQPVNNPLLALQGRVPGLTVLQANGIAGGGITVRIQGRNNLDPNLVGSDPFIVIDGVPYASQNLSTFNGGQIALGQSILGSSSNDGGSPITNRNFGSPLSFINPADIESITVLRDADATAIYGSRAANGAILITTKKGKKGDIRTDINFQQGFGQVPKKMDLLNNREYMEMRWEAKRNDGLAV
ncbi:MAG: TonB-dependent receptor plug domain-containing protein, partial [Chitinophagaceae bacterium]|nr:TonB-dependent receptor plug domain-containing protein [Chitinophagaceae bacterium]